VQSAQNKVQASHRTGKKEKLMLKEDKQRAAPTRRRFLGCAGGALGIAAAPIREEPEVVIPLSTVVATSGQEGLAEAPWKLLMEDEDLKRLVDPTAIGPSNLFLVSGSDIEGAVRATWGHFFSGRRVDQIRISQRQVHPNQPPSPKPKFWFFAYFGSSHTSPTEWAVTRVAAQRERVQVTVSRPDPKKVHARLRDDRVYMIWVPLGERSERTFTLQAYDERNRVMMMTRGVLVVES
jgi:hypothetical protein